MGRPREKSRLTLIPLILFSCLGISVSATKPKAVPKIKLDQRLQLQFEISSTSEDAKRVIQALRLPQNKQKPLRYPFEPFLAFCKLEMHDSIQSFGARYIQRNTDSGRCTYFASIPVAISLYTTGNFKESRLTLEKSFSICNKDPKSKPLSYDEQMLVANLMARILERQGKIDTSRMLVAPWITDGLEMVAYHLFSSLPKQQICHELNAALNDGLKTGHSRPRSSSPLIQFLLNAKSSPYEHSLYFAPFKLSIPIYTRTDPPTIQDLNSSTSLFKENLLYRLNDCDLK